MSKQEMPEDLEWLARNVSEWNDDFKYATYNPHYYLPLTWHTWLRSISEGNAWTKPQWLQARQALGLDQPEVTSEEEEEWQRRAEQQPGWAESVPEGVEKYSDYFKDVRHLSYIDVYRAVDLFGCEKHGHPISHAAKKLLLSGVRTGGKAVEDDVREAIDTLTRWLQMREEDRNAL